MTDELQKEITDKIAEIKATILTPGATFADVVVANVKCDEVIEVLETAIGLNLTQVSARAAAVDDCEAKLERTHKIETNIERSLLRKAKGFLSTLKHQEYRLSK